MFIYGRVQIFWTDYSSAFDDAIESLQTYITSYSKKQKEIEIIQDHIDHEILNEDLRKKVIDYLSSYKKQPEKNIVKYNIVVLLGFSRKSLFTKLEDKEDKSKVFLERYQKEVDKFINKFEDTIDKFDIEPFSIDFHYILLPFSCVQTLKKGFL